MVGSNDPATKICIRHPAGRKIMLYQQYIGQFFFSTGVKIDLLKILVIDKK